MRTLSTIMLAAICVVGYAQKKPKINQALSALEDGNLAEAKLIIDAAIEHEKTKDDPKTWYFRGQIYAVLDTTTNESGALEEAIEAFNKALELDPEQEKISTFTGTGIENVDTKRQGYYAYYYNEAIVEYNAKSYGKAADNFETAFYINPSDTNAILNAAYAASANGNDERAKANFIKSYEAGVRDKMVFLQLYNFAIQKKDFEEGLKYIKQGKSEYPDDVELAKYEINLLIQLDRTDEAKEELQRAISSDPENADLYFSLGVLKDELDDREGALKSYMKAIEIDPNHFNANFNYGVSQFNVVNELIKERNELSYTEKEKTKQLTKRIDEQLKTALPIWEKLYSINNQDETVLQTLGYIYNNLGDDKNYDKIQRELELLIGEGN